MTTREELIEVMARAICAVSCNPDGHVYARPDSQEMVQAWRANIDHAEAALDAIGTVAAVVPQEATDEICTAVGFDEPFWDYKDSYVGKEHVIAYYRRAVAAADLTQAEIAS